MSIRNLPRRFGDWFKLLTNLAAPKAKSPAISDPLPSPEMAKVHGEQVRIKGLIDDAARDGLVPDAHVLSLYAANTAEMAELYRQFGEEEAAYQASLMRLDAMFPEPPAPPPEPPAPKPAQRYPRLGDLLGERGRPAPLH
jgi:hypothetical protein